jgi:hypothetical protein
VTQGSDIVCTFTNTRDQGKIELRKVWVGTGGQTTLKIGTSAGGNQTSGDVLTGPNGTGPLTTGQLPVNTGTYFVSETGGLTDYDSSLACFNDNGAGGGTAGNSIQDGSEPVVTSTGGNVAVTQGSDIVCTFTNTRDQGKIELR